MSEEKIKKNEWSVFFLVGHDFTSLEESSTVEYSECALTIHYKKYKHDEAN